MKPVSGLPDSKIADQSGHNQHKLQLEVLFCGLVILLACVLTTFMRGLALSEEWCHKDSNSEKDLNVKYDQ